MPTTIAIMFSSYLISIFLVILHYFQVSTISVEISKMLLSVDFHHLLMKGMLSFLLFAGALNVNLNDLSEQKWEIGVLAILGTLASTILIGYGSYYLLLMLGVNIDFIYCLLFGALISPTDPIAVLSIFNSIKAPKKMSIYLEGESLFNDGVGIVLFTSIYAIAFTGYEFDLHGILLLFFRQALGGLVYGILLGYIAYRAIKPIENHRIEILITIAVATGGYAFAEYLHISGPLAMVAAGIMIGNHGRNFSMSANTSENLDIFWEVIDEVLNAILFLLIGFEVIVIDFGIKQVILGCMVIVLTLGVRFICVAGPMQIFKQHRRYFPHMNKILLWGGLRGGLSVALALSLPEGHQRELILTMTYSVVAFSIIVQGLTMKPLIKLAMREERKVVDNG